MSVTPKGKSTSASAATSLSVIVCLSLYSGTHSARGEPRRARARVRGSTLARTGGVLGAQRVDCPLQAKSAACLSWARSGLQRMGDPSIFFVLFCIRDVSSLRCGAFARGVTHTVCRLVASKIPIPSRPEKQGAWGCRNGLSATPPGLPRRFDRDHQSVGLPITPRKVVNQGFWILLTALGSWRHATECPRSERESGSVITTGCLIASPHLARPATARNLQPCAGTPPSDA